MKKIVLLCLIVSLGGWGAFAGQTLIDPEDLSLKAGPTQPGEELSLVWLETYVYPKVVQAERVISLGTRLTASVDKITVSFDFNQAKVSLNSTDNLNWSGAYEVPDNVSSGVHLVRFTIFSQGKSIQRTVDFVVAQPTAASQQSGIASGEGIESASWQLIVSATCAAWAEDGTRILYSGEPLLGVAKATWYRVIFPDGQAGWVASNLVQEPIDQYFALGYQAYQQGHYQEAITNLKKVIALNDRFMEGYFWLSKSYFRLKEYEPAAKMVKVAVQLDERNMEARILANAIAYAYYQDGEQQFRAGRYNDAVAAFLQVVALQPSSLASWIKLGKSYQQLGIKEAAREAWLAALRLDPEEPQPYALLGLERGSSATAVEMSNANNIPAVLADDSLKIVKEIKTDKGTKIEKALNSVVALTKSLGTPVVEKGWQVKQTGDKYLVRYLCEQSSGALEVFEWLVDVDSKQALANNDNARMLMNRW